MRFLIGLIALSLAALLQPSSAQERQGYVFDFPDEAAPQTLRPPHAEQPGIHQAQIYIEPGQRYRPERRYDPRYDPRYEEPRYVEPRRRYLDEEDDEFYSPRRPPPRRQAAGSVCWTSRGSCYLGYRAPPQSPCRCNIPGFGQKRGAVQ